jgi:hypothetical protein
LRAEALVDKAVLVCVILIVPVVLVDLFAHDVAMRFATQLFLIDTAIIGVFATDLGFKYQRLKQPRPFLKKHWLDLIALTPVFLIMRGFEGFAKLADRVGRGQNLFGELLYIEQQGVRIAHLHREHQLARIIPSIERSPRLLRAYTFFARPEHRHPELHRPAKKSRK